MDKNFDGKLTKEEMLAGFKALDMANPEEEVEKIFRMADFDDNGFIEFSEWCTIAMDKRKMLSQERLQGAFDIFDEDKNGYISLDEVKKLLGHGMAQNNETFKEMIYEMDRDGDGRISFKEFSDMMQTLII